MRLIRWAVVATMLALPAHGAGLGLEAAGGAWLPETPQFQVTLRVHQQLGRHLQVGLRAGVLLNVRPAVGVGVPLDVSFRIHIKRLFLEPLGGPTFLFGEPYFLRAHLGLAIGAQLQGWSISMEAGWLQPNALLLLRFGVDF